MQQGNGATECMYETRWSWCSIATQFSECLWAKTSVEFKHFQGTSDLCEYLASPYCVQTAGLASSYYVQTEALIGRTPAGLQAVELYKCRYTHSNVRNNKSGVAGWASLVVCDGWHTQHSWVCMCVHCTSAGKESWAGPTSLSGTLYNPLARSAPFSQVRLVFFIWNVLAFAFLHQVVLSFTVFRKLLV